MTYTLSIPVDASELDDFEPGTVVKVGAEMKDGSIVSQSFKLSESGKGAVKLEFKEPPGSLRVAVGPGDASDEELMGLQTINFNITPQQWRDETTIKVEAVRVTPHYWQLWRRWCRTFVVRGRIVCPDGSPVPGAEVCAYDVDWWWWWCSSDKVGCDTTDENGSFEIKFRHCCGWWPWWWWGRRYWHLEPNLSREIMPLLRDKLQLKKLPRPSPRPDLKIFNELLGEDVGLGGTDFDIDNDIDIGGGRGGEFLRRAPQDPSRLQALRERADELRSKRGIDLSLLQKIRLKLAERIPVVAKLERVRLWPWWPWSPWDDCAPDLIFRASQKCEDENRVIVNETCWDTRWNVAPESNVTLIANNACCIDDCDSQQNCPEGDCVILSKACNVLMNRIGGNPDAPALPAGYVDPGVSDRPFAGVVPIRGLFGSGASVDYYEFEMSEDGGATFDPIPHASAGDFTRGYWGPKLGDPTDVGVHFVPFNFNIMDGRCVVESRQHFEDTHEPGTWGAGKSRRWIHNFDLMMVLKTENLLADGLYRFRVKTWTMQSGALTNPQILKLCETEEDNRLVLRLDNQLTDSLSAHPTSTVGHPVGGVHVDTLEPDTDFITVMIDGNPVDPCDIIDAGSAQKLQLRFLAHDPDGHLYKYEIHATYGENQLRNLLNQSSSTLAISSASHIGPTYTAALTQGAISPVWAGGIYTLEVDVAQAFPESCAYTLVLRAYKRPIKNCSGNYVMRNQSTYSFTVIV